MQSRRIYGLCIVYEANTLHMIHVICFTSCIHIAGDSSSYTKLCIDIWPLLLYTLPTLEDHAVSIQTHVFDFINPTSTLCSSAFAPHLHQQTPMAARVKVTVMFTYPCFTMMVLSY